jgi:hypothetical protein
MCPLTAIILVPAVCKTAAVRHRSAEGELQSAVAAKVARHAAEKGYEQLSPMTVEALSGKL